ncbi:MAG TPA: hypothetical protein V6C81_06545 [Planktothrix sp.]
MRFTRVVVAGFCMIALAAPVLAKKAPPADSPLTPEQQSLVDRAAHNSKNTRGAEKAAPLFLQALQSANDMPKCLAIAAGTEEFGSATTDVRRKCLDKAISLSTTPEDLLQISLKARQYEIYDAARTAVNKLLATANTPDQLYDLARKAQELACNDVVHLALEKAFSKCKTYDAGIEFMKQSKLLGAEDMTRKCMKDMIDDEGNTHNLLTLLTALEPYGMKDVNRYLLKKCLDVSSTFEDYVEIAGVARRQGMPDVREIAIYRAKKKKLQQQISTDQTKYAEQMDQYKQGQAAAAAAAAQNQAQSQQDQKTTTGPADNTPKSGF